MKIANFKIGTRLGIGFGIVMLLLAVIIAIGVTRLRDEYESSNYTISTVYPKTAAAQRISFLSMDVARAVRNLILNKEPIAIGVNKELIDKDRAEIDALMDKYDKSISSTEGRRLFVDIQTTREVFNNYTNAIVELALKGEDKEATQLLYGPNYKSQSAYLAALKAMLEHEEELMADGGKQARLVYDRAQTLMIGLGVAALLIGMIVAWIITRALLNELGGEPKDTAAIANRIASGDLTVAIETKARDHSSLMFAMKAMRNKLNDIVSEVRIGTDIIATASNQIASGNFELSSRTEQQAGSLEETASSMEELTSTVKQNADNARQANQLAVSASDVAVKGSVVVAQVVDTMGAINDSAKKIVDIIGVIDGIAFQTNILALNAAVEAARAGEQGRGFAVVATEVRNLAQRSAAAAKDIKTLIGDSVEKVDAGAKLVDQAGVTMHEIVDSVKRVTDIMSEITAASREQSAGIEQINQAIIQMDDVTQQNAALVEEAAAAAASLQDQAGTLAEVVSVFKLEKSPEAVKVAEKSESRPAPVAVSRVVPMADFSKKKIRPAVGRQPAKKLVNAYAGVNGDWSEY